MQNLKGKNEIALLVQLFVLARKTGKFTYVMSYRLSLPWSHPCYGKLIFPKCPAHSENPGREPGAMPFVNAHLVGGPPLIPHVQVETQPMTKPSGKKQWLIKMDFKGWGENLINLIFIWKSF